MDIGKKIRELRKQKGLTQEQLADSLNISFQSVSKWETGLTLPDLTMIPGLTRLLDCTADELLGLSGSPADERRNFFDHHYRDFLSRPHDAADLDLARQAAAEYPGDPQYMYWLASAEYYNAFESGWNQGDRETFRGVLERALQHALGAYDGAQEEILRRRSLSLIVQTLVHLDRRAEAKDYAKLCPSSLPIRKEDLFELCAEGEEKLALQQERIKACALDLLQKLLNYWRSKDLHDESVQAAISAAESIVRSLVPDDHLLQFHSILYHVFAARAVLAGYDGAKEEMIQALLRAKEHAAAFGMLFGGGAQQYTAPLFCRCTVDYPPLPPQTTPPEEEFRELLEKNTFDPYRSLPEFAAIAE
ncbi:MAG: helix-turn-helix transcriptional regulator [Oscillospiraceae bacterium]|nr:helix-turn-helix transcriptional regulator [Oscillospiraceae bacterium]